MNKRNSLLAIIIALFSILAVTTYSSSADTTATTVMRVLAPRGIVSQRTAGVELWHDYGSFALYRMTGDAYAKLSTDDKQVVQTGSQLDTIELEGSPINTKGRSPQLADGWRVSAENPDHSLHLVQFVGPIKQGWLDALAGIGVTPVHYINTNAYLVWADAAGRANLDHLVADGDFLQYSGAYHPQYKLGRTLRETLIDSELTKENDLVTVTVQMLNHNQKAATESIVKAVTVEKISEWQPILAYQNTIITVKRSDIKALAQQTDVYWVGERLERELHDEIQGQIVAGNLTANGVGPASTGYLAWLNSYGFSTNPNDYPIVDVTDDGIGNGNAAQAGGDQTLRVNGDASSASRVAYISSCANSGGEGDDGHGHINISIAGGFETRTGFPFIDPNGYNRGLGINPFGRFAGTRIFDPSFDQSSCGGSDTGVIKSSQDDGAVISTNSWGCSGCAGSYDDSSQAYDVGVRDADQTEAGNQPLITIFSAGNSGTSSGTIGTPGNGKNMITVGASENPRPTDEDGNWTDGCNVTPTGANSAMDVIDFSSRGPAPGNRIKPEIIAPGTHIQGTSSTVSAFTGNGVCDQFRPSGQTVYSASSGTSHSTPAVAGIASLYYYWLENTHGITAPSPAMMKAYMIAHPTYLTGVDAGDTLPSNNQGYGMPNMTIAFDDALRVLEDQTTTFNNTGEEFTWSGSVADPTKPVRIVLAYTDAAGAIGTNPEVNNLNLQAVFNGSTIYRGNNFNGQWSTSGGSLDADNNYEAIFLPTGTNGAFEITITAANIAGDGIPNSGDTTDQDFALVCYNCAQNPNFTMATTPESLSVCAPDNASFTLNTGQILGFTDPISLAVNGAPAGATTNFSPNPVLPMGSSTLTVGTSAATPGSYLMDIVGVSTTGSQTSTVMLELYDGIATVPTLSAPVDGSATASALPTLSWSSTSGVASYEVQIATDPAFTAIVDTGTTPTNSFTPATTLTEGQVYYWRIRTVNTCGTSAWSSVSGFRVIESNLACSDAYGPYGFERGANGWTHTAGEGTDTWAISGAEVNTGSAAFFGQDINTVSDQYLISPPINIPATATQSRLHFWQWYDLEPAFDGGVLEFSTNNGGSWADIGEANLLTTAYNDDISTSYSSPIGGRNAWTGAFTTWREAIVDIDALAGATVNFRFRLATDSSIADVGWAIDDVRVETCEPFSNDADYSDLASSYGAAWHLGEGTTRLGTNWTVDSSFATSQDDDNDDIEIPNLPVGSATNVMIPVGSAGRLQLYFDWNGNGLFDNSELVYNDAVSSGTQSIAITPPNGADSSAVPFRVRLFESTTNPGFAATGGATGGEVEDGITSGMVPAAVEFSGADTASPSSSLPIIVTFTVLLALGLILLRRREI